MTTPNLARELARLAALRKLDMIGARDVVSWAADLVQKGELNDNLFALSLQSPSDASAVDALLISARSESGLGDLSELQVGRLAAASIAGQLADGQLEPIEAARAIWKVAVLAPASEAVLRPFIGLASEWDDDPENRDVYDEEIRSLALSVADW